MRFRPSCEICECRIPEGFDGGGRILPLYGSAGDIVGKVNSSQDGAVCHRNAVVPCLTSGHGNCPKVITYEDVDHPDEGQGA